ncbi:MAG: hypothetical protein HOQ05_04265 [Corynebacteriales bacterium]|nr:hypothetical protein [Mycobacteriales bacterium]
MSPEPVKKEVSQQNTKDDDTLRKDLSFTQIVASALAAVSASFAASYFNVIGTIVGAAIISVVATVGSALYKHSLDRSKVALKNAAETVPWTPRQLAERRAALASAAAEDTPPTQHVTSVRTDTDTAIMPATEESTTRADEATTTPRTVSNLRKKFTAKPLNWKHIAAAAAAVFVITVGAVTTVELVGGAPLSSLLWGNDKEGTSIGGVIGGRDEGDKRIAPKPSKTTETPQMPGPSYPTESPTPSETPQPSSESPTPTPTPSVTPTPTPSSSTTPSPSPTLTNQNPQAAS